MEKITALAKSRGFFYPGSDLYGGLANTYDYGPVGAELLRNIRNLWWSYFVTKRSDVVGLDASVISNHKIWEASGHTASFADAMIDCKNCKSRFRADHLIEDYLEDMTDEEKKFTNLVFEPGYFDISEDEVKNVLETGKVEGLSEVKLNALIKGFQIKCRKCKQIQWTPVRKFNQLFPVQLGLVEGEGGSAYLRGETAQNIFIDFKLVVDSNRVRLPFGIAQLGKSFRNEITPGNSIFRTIEFEQGELEYFFDPEVTNWEKTFDTWKETMYTFVTQALGVQSEKLRWRTHSDEERSFYSTKTEDLEYQFPFGFKELWGLAYRTDYDLQNHMKNSGRDLSIVDPQTGKKIVPHVIEPAVGINRLLLMVLSDAFTQEEDRVVLKFAPKVAPVKAAVFPLLANKPELTELAQKVYQTLQEKVNGKILWDDRGNIGKRYLSQDEIGTPYCITVDFQSLEDQSVTVRDRDSKEQKRVAISELVSYIQERLV